MFGLKQSMTILSAAVFSVALMGSAVAGDHGRGHGKHHGKHHHDQQRQTVVIDRGARVVINQYYDGYSRKAYKCPPGLMKKHNACRPKGWVKQRYMIGRPLPPTVVISPMPPVLIQQLPPAPYGYAYQYVDGDVLMVAEATHRVVDAVVAVNAAMNYLR